MYFAVPVAWDHAQKTRKIPGEIARAGRCPESGQEFVEAQADQRFSLYISVLGDLDVFVGARKHEFVALDAHFDVVTGGKLATQNGHGEGIL